MKLTEQLIRDMRIALRKRTYQIGGTEYRTYRAYKVRNPHVWWYDHESWEISIFCEHNSHGEYALELSPSKTGDHDPEFWFCFLRNGQHGNTFLHLKHLKEFEELQAIVSALTDLRLCRNEWEAKEYLEGNPG